MLIWNMLTLTLTDKNNVLAMNYFPVDLDYGDCEFSPTDFETYYILANVNLINNKFYYGNEKNGISPKDRTNRTNCMI